MFIARELCIKAFSTNEASRIIADSSCDSMTLVVTNHLPMRTIRRLTFPERLLELEADDGTT